MVTLNSVINTHKVLVLPVVLGLMWYFHNWGPAAFLYLGMHGTYTFLWLMKEDIYPDKSFEQKVPFGIGLAIFLPLATYLIAPYLLISRHTILPAWVFAAAPAIYAVGMFLEYVGDAQKYFVLQLRRGLIVDGLFARTRNPNYLGEIMIYGAFALTSWHWLSLLVLATWLLFFFHNMRRKDRSLSRYPAFAEYAKRTGMLLPAFGRRTAASHS